MERPARESGRQFRGLSNPVVALGLLCGLLIAGRCSLGSLGVRGELSDGRPALWCPDSVKALDLTAPGDESVVLFPVHNRGTRRLVLNPAEAGCQCDDDRSRTIVVPPGGRQNIAVTVPAHSAGAPLGKTVRFLSNDPLHPQLELTVTAEDTQPGAKLRARHGPPPGSFGVHANSNEQHR